MVWVCGNATSVKQKQYLPINSGYGLLHDQIAWYVIKACLLYLELSRLELVYAGSFW